jgi:hypothetical protein
MQPTSWQAGGSRIRKKIAGDSCPIDRASLVSLGLSSVRPDWVVVTLRKVASLSVVRQIQVRINDMRAEPSQSDQQATGMNVSVLRVYGWEWFRTAY